MTRINCVPPFELTDKHLVAEYRELPRVFAKARHCECPNKYVLGTGHVIFFYNKLKYLTNRHKELVAEMLKRGFNVNYPNPPGCSDPTLYNDWQPDEAAIALNRARIADRLTKQGDVV